MWNLLLCLTVAVGVAACLWGLHRLCILFEDRGYMYYRKKRPETGGGGGMAGALFELSKLERPSVEHVVAANDVTVVSKDDAIGGK